MLPILLLLGLRSTDPVTFSCRVERVEMAVAELAAATHRPMRTAEPLSSEIVYLNLRNMPLAQAMKTLADATCGQWNTDKEGVYVLSRPDWMVQAEKTKETSRRLKHLEAWRAGLVNSLESPYDYDSLISDVKQRAALQTALNSGEGNDSEREAQGNHLTELNNLDPACRAMARCLADFDFTPVANLNPQAGVTYAFQPNAAQSALSSSALSCLNALQPEQLLFGKALRAATPIVGDDTEDHRFTTDDTINFFKNSSGDFGVQLEPWTRTLPYAQAPRYALLSFFCYSEDAYECHFRLFDARGNGVLTIVMNDISTFDSEPEAKPAQVENPRPSPKTLAFWARWDAKPKAPPILNEALRKDLENPVEHDPISFGNQELLDELARQTNKSVVACLPDSLLCFDKETYSLQTYVKNWASHTLSRVENGSVIEFKPSNFDYHWLHHLDRHRMADCAKAIEHNHRLDLATYVQFCATGSDQGNELIAAIPQLLDPTYSSMRGSFSLPFQSAFTPLFASLSSGQKATLEAGGTVPYRDLSPQQLAWVSDILYGVRVNVDEEGSDQVDSQQEPTLELPAGALQGAGLSATIHTDHVVTFINPGNGDSFFSVNVDRSPQFYGWNGPPPRLPAGGMATALYDIQEEHTVSLKCALSPGHFIVGRFASPDRPSGAKPVGLAQVPDQMQDTLKKFIKMFNEMFDSTKQNDGQGKGP